jgi:translation initiation factor 1
MSQVCPKCGNPINANICSTCGLPSDICACVEIDRETQRIRIYTTRRRFSKPVTIVEGIRENAKQTLKELRKELATGGTFKEDHIEL